MDGMVEPRRFTNNSLNSWAISRVAGSRWSMAVFPPVRLYTETPSIFKSRLNASRRAFGDSAQVPSNQRFAPSAQTLRSDTRRTGRLQPDRSEEHTSELQSLRHL